METYLPLIVAVILYLMRIREFLIKRDTIKGPVKEKVSFILLFAGGTLVVFSSIAEFLLFARNPSIFSVIAGAALTLAAFAYRNWAIRTLGKFWSVHVEIRDNHQLIESGPFKRTRHPVYSAAILEAIGIVVVLHAYLSSFIIFFVIIPGILYRIKIEEAALIEKFSISYKEYMKRTGILLPKLF